MARWMLIATVVLLAGCGPTRRYGDDQGIPVAFAVQLDRAFVRAMENRQWRPSVGAGASYGSDGHSSHGVGVGLSFSSTQVYLLGGEGPAESQVFRQELGWGDNAFTVPLAPGRVLHLTVMARGGREGWEAIGSITVPKAIDPRVRITLDSRGGSIALMPLPEPPTEASAAQEPPTGSVGAPAQDHDVRARPVDEPPPPVEIRPAPPPRAVTPAAPYPDPALDR